MNGEAKDFGGFPKRNLQACAKMLAQERSNKSSKSKLRNNLILNQLVYASLQTEFYQLCKLGSNRTI